MNLNYTAPINTLSYGVVGLNILKGLVNRGANVSWFPIGGVEAMQSDHTMLAKCYENSSQYDKDANSLRLYHEFDLAQHVGKGKHIGWPIFEVTEFNERRKHHLQSQDELIVCSDWARNVCQQNGVTSNINVVPLGVDPTIFYPKTTVQEGPTRFIHVGKRECRKGQLEMLRCFEKAFTVEDDVELIVVWGSQILKQMNPQEHDSWTKLFQSSNLASKITLIEWVPSQVDVANLLRRADCGLFLSKSEGFNLGLLECLAVGTHAIATNWSGHTEYVNTDNSYLVEIDDEEIIWDGVWFKDYDCGKWAAFGPNQEECVINDMRHICNAKQDGLLGVNTAGVKTGTSFTWDNSVTRLLEVL